MQHVLLVVLIAILLLITKFLTCFGSGIESYEEKEMYKKLMKIGCSLITICWICNIMLSMITFN